MTSYSREAQSPIALVSIDLDTGHASSHGRLDRVQYADAAFAADRYRQVAAEMMTDTETLLTIAFDPALRPTRNSSARYLAAADRQPRLVDAITEATGNTPPPEAILIVFGPSFAAWRTTDAMFREVVSDDLAHIIGSLHPIACDGPISPLMPYLLQVAGSILIGGGSRPQGDEMMEQTKERAVGKAFTTLAHTHYDLDNALGQAVSDHPAWLALSDEVADTAASIAYSFDEPMRIDVLAQHIHRTVASALRTMGVSIETRITEFAP